MPYLERDGVALVFERSGGGKPVVLIHGWCCDRSFLAPQAAHLAAQGFDVISVDLRGHGESDKPVQDYPISAFADDVAFLCDRLGLENPLLIGHSMGGIIAYDVACRFPTLPGAIVMIDAAVVRPAALSGSMAENLEKLRGPDYKAALSAIVEATLFIPSDDPARKARILDIMTSAPQQMMAAAYVGLAEFRPGTLGHPSATPSLYIAADEPSPRSDIAGLRAIAPGLLYGQTVGSGHFCQLEVPEQVNAMIDRFVGLLPPRPTAA